MGSDRSKSKWMGIARPKKQESTNKGGHKQSEAQHKSRSDADTDTNIFKEYINCVAKCYSKEDQSESDVTRTIAKWTRYIGFFNLALVIVTGGLVYVGLRSDDTAREGQRAFVSTGDIEIKVVDHPKIPNAPLNIVRSVRISWENSGSTHTKNLRLGQALIIEPKTITWPQDFVAKANVLLPKQISRTTLDLPIPGNALNDIAKVQGLIVFFGLAKYEDIFDTRHITLTCNIVRPRPEIDYMTDASGAIDIGSCGKYNCADSECYSYKDDPSVRKELEYLQGKE